MWIIHHKSIEAVVIIFMGSLGDVDKAKRDE